MSMQSPPPQLPQSISVLAAIAATSSITLWIVLWAIAAIYLADSQRIFAQIDFELPAISEWAVQLHAWMWISLGAVWSGLFCYGARQRWFSQWQAKLLLMGTILLTWIWSAAVFLAIVAPSFIVMEEIG
ncbi:MAG: hypothetical protein ACFCA4_16480 [Cyanophyceae cyanobacterium]